MSEEIEHKQSYLYEQIINNGYDGEEFMKYMINARPDIGADLEKWKFSELQNIVQEFQQYNQKMNQESSEQGQNQFDDNYYQQQLQLHTEEEKQQEIKNNIQIKKNSPLKKDNSPLKQKQESIVNQNQVIQNSQTQNKEEDLFDNWNHNNFQKDTHFNPNDNNLWKQEENHNNNHNNDDLFNSFNPQSNQNAQNQEIDLFGEFYQQNVPQKAQQQQQFQQVQQNHQKNNVTNLDFDELFGNHLNSENQNNIQQQNQNDKKQIEQKSQQSQQTNLWIPATLATPVMLDKDNNNQQKLQTQQQPKIQQQTQQQQQAQPQQQNQQSQQTQSTQPSQKVDDNQKRNISQSKDSQKKEQVANNQSTAQFISEKQCKKSVLTVVGSKEQVIVQIQSFQVVSGSLLKQPFAIYNITTMPFNWNVKRNNSDFMWLKTILEKMHPGVPIPPFPEKTLNAMNENLANRRKIYFQCFLDQILHNQQLKNSKYLTDFLSISDEKTFKQRQKETEKFHTPKNLNEIETYNGKYYLNKNPECQNQSQIIEQYLTQNDLYYEKLKVLQKQLETGYSQVQQTLIQISEVFGQLKTNVSTYNQKAFSEYKQNDLEELYKIMNNIYLKQGTLIQEEQTIFGKNAYNFFKFHKDSLNGIKDILKIRNEMNSALTKKAENVSQGMFNTIFGKYKEAVYNPSKILKELEDQAGYYNHQMCNEFKLMLMYKSKYYSKYFFDNLCQLKSIYNDYLKQQSDFLQGIKQLYEGKGEINVKQ